MTSPTNQVAPNTTITTIPEEVSHNIDTESSTWNARDVLQLDKDSGQPSANTTDSLFSSNVPAPLEVKKPNTIDEELALLKVSLPAALHTVVVSFLNPTPEIMDLVKNEKEVPEYLKRIAETVVRLDISDPTLGFKQFTTLLTCFKNIKILALPNYSNNADAYYSHAFSETSELVFSPFSEFICAISTLRNLEELDLSSWISSKMIKDFPNMYELIASAGKIVRLNLSGNKITSEHFSSIFRSFKDVEYLSLNKCAINDHNLKEIKNLTSLKSLELENNKAVTIDGIHDLSEMTTLEHLNISGNTNVTDDWLEIIAQFSNLKSLNISRCNITEMSLTILSNLTGLTRLDARSCDGMSDSIIINNIIFFPKLQSLDVSDSAISDESLPYIGKLNELEHLDISGTSVRRGGLVNLYQLKKLKTLTAYGIAMTRFDIKGIKKEIPGIKVLNKKTEEERRFKIEPFDTTSLPNLIAGIFSNIGNFLNDL